MNTEYSPSIRHLAPYSSLSLRNNDHSMIAPHKQKASTHKHANPPYLPPPPASHPRITPHLYSIHPLNGHPSPTCRASTTASPPIVARIHPWVARISRLSACMRRWQGVQKRLCKRASLRYVTICSCGETDQHINKSLDSCTHAVRRRSSVRCFRCSGDAAERV